MKILITGGCGYIGSHVSALFLNSDHEVCVVDNLSNSRIEVVENIKTASKKEVIFRKVDLKDKTNLESVFIEFSPEVVVHMAGFKSVPLSFLQPTDFYVNNVVGSLNLLQVMAKFGCEKIIFSSSATVYGHPKYLPIDEKHAKGPKNPYGKTKNIIEEILSDWSTEHSLRSVVALRYFNPLGGHISGLLGEPMQSYNDNISTNIMKVLFRKNEKFFIFGNDYNTVDGTAERDYIHVEDVATAHLQCLNYLSENSGFKAINLATGVSTSILKLLKMFEKVSGEKIPFVFSPRRLGDFDKVWADPALASSLIEWTAKYNLEEMCRSAFQYTKNFVERINFD